PAARDAPPRIRRNHGSLITRADQRLAPSGRLRDARADAAAGAGDPAPGGGRDRGAAGSRLESDATGARAHPRSGRSAAAGRGRLPDAAAADLARTLLGLSGRRGAARNFAALVHQFDSGAERSEGKSRIASAHPREASRRSRRLAARFPVASAATLV